MSSNQQGLNFGAFSQTIDERRQADRNAMFGKIIDDYTRHLAAVTRTPWHSAIPAAKGDKITATVTGYVSSVNDDGKVTITATRDPFGDAPIVATVNRVACGVIERAPAAPKVGDVITGAVLKATPWRRGTVVTWLSPFGGRREKGYVLMPDGTWTGTDCGTREVLFRHFANGCDVRVEYAPGKTA